MKTKLNDILEELKKPLSYKWKPQSQNKDKTKWQCVAYIDSRDVQNILDTVCIWQNEFYEVKGKLFCKIGIYTEDYGTLWRSDSGFLENEFIEDGTESKGEVSDTFKRAGVQWGIGRFLYSKQIQWITSEEYNANKYKLTEFIESKLNNGNYTAPKTEVSKENTDHLPWIAQENIDKLTDLIADGKHFTMVDIRKKYKVSKVNAEKLKAIGIN